MDLTVVAINVAAGTADSSSNHIAMLSGIMHDLLHRDVTSDVDILSLFLADRH